MDEEAQTAVADPLAIMKRDETENNGRDQVYGMSLANETLQHLHCDNPDVLNHAACFLTHPQGQVTCKECNPYLIVLRTDVACL